MVYANYTPAKLPTVASDLDRAIMAVTNLETLEVIGKLLYNCAVNPKEEKYRRVRLSNPKIQSVIGQVPGAVDMMLALGWTQEVTEGEEALVLPTGKFMSMKEVRMIEDQKDRARKDARVAQAEAIRRAAQQQTAV